MSDVLVSVTIRLEDHKEDRRSGVLPGPPYPLVFIDLMEDPLTRVRLVARTSEALRELADHLRDLAERLDADTPAIALMKKGIAEMRDDLARGDEDADRGGEP